MPAYDENLNVLNYQWQFQDSVLDSFGFNESSILIPRATLKNEFNYNVYLKVLKEHLGIINYFNFTFVPITCKYFELTKDTDETIYFIHEGNLNDLQLIPEGSLRLFTSLDTINFELSLIDNGC